MSKDSIAIPAELKRQPYMNDIQLDYFKNKLFEIRDEAHKLISQAQNTLTEHADLHDEADFAQYEEDARLALRVVDRETRLLKKVEHALNRIRTGEYGYCLQNGDPIGVERLMVRPTAEYSAEVKALLEMREKHYGKNR